MNIPEKLVKAVMNSCSTDEKTAKEYIESGVRSIHEWMDKGVDPSSQTGYGGNYFEEELDNLGLDMDYELDFAELCVYNYQPKEKFYLYIDGKKDQVFADQDDAEDEAVAEFETGHYKTVEVKNDKGEVIWGTEDIKNWVDDYKNAVNSRYFVEEQKNGEWWRVNSSIDLEKAKEYACDVFETRWKPVRIVNGIGKVILDFDAIKKDWLKKHRGF